MVERQIYKRRACLLTNYTQNYTYSFYLALLLHRAFTNLGVRVLRSLVVMKSINNGDHFDQIILHAKQLFEPILINWYVSPLFFLSRLLLA